MRPRGLLRPSRRKRSSKAESLRHRDHLGTLHLVDGLALVGLVHLHAWHVRKEAAILNH